MIEAGDILFAWQAVQEASRKFEHEASKLVWARSGSEADLHKAVTLVVDAVTLFEAAIKQLVDDKPNPTPPSPPKCGPGFHEEEGVCVANGL